LSERFDASVKKAFKIDFMVAIYIVFLMNIVFVFEEKKNQMHTSKIKS